MSKLYAEVEKLIWLVFQRRQGTTAAYRGISVG
jgi:hypothetical protein